jgi:hypothetical protein
VPLDPIGNSSQEKICKVYLFKAVFRIWLDPDPYSLASPIRIRKIKKYLRIRSTALKRSESSVLIVAQNLFCFYTSATSVVGVLDELCSTKPAQPSSHTGPPGYIGWTRLQLM